MKHIEVVREDKVFVFKDNKTIRCTKEENQKFFDCKMSENSEVVYCRVAKIVAMSLFIVANPSTVFALGSIDKTILDEICNIVIQGTTIVTFLRIINLFNIGYSEYRVQAIIRDFLEVVLATILIPNLPTIIKFIF